METDKETGVWMDGVKLTPTVSERLELHMPYNRGLNEQYDLTILDHPVKIYLNGDCTISLKSDSFIKRWIEEGVIENYNNDPSAPPVLESVLKVQCSDLTNVTFFGAADIEACRLEDCDVIGSRLSSVRGYNNPAAKGIQFHDVRAHSVSIDGPGVVVDSTLFDVQIDIKEGGTVEIIKCGLSDVSITGEAIFLGRTSLDDVWLASGSNVTLVRTRLEHFTGNFPNVELRNKFDHFIITLPSFNLVVIKDSQSDDNFWVTVEDSVDLGVPYNAPAGAFDDWLTHQLKIKGEQHLDSILEYVEECIQSRLKVIKQINTREYLRLSAVC
jgi:hypothetical protein